MVAWGQKHIPSAQPKLVLFLMLDELSAEQLFVLRNRLSDDGFNRLLSGGAYFKNATYPSMSHYPGASIATIYTGAYPSTHGIISNQWFEQFKEKEVNALYGELGSEPHIVVSDQILSSGIYDEMNRLYGDSSKVAAVGFDPDKLLWTVGQAVNKAWWLDAKSGVFTSARDTSLLPEPVWVAEFNSKKLLDVYTEREWGPLNDIHEYHQYAYFGGKMASSPAFLYKLEKTRDKQPYHRVSGSPYGNKLVRDFAASLLLNESFGKDHVPDLLTISFNTKPSVKTNGQLFSPESEDLLLRLDREIADLLKLVDDEVGLEHTLVVASGVAAPGKTLTALHTNDKGSFNGKKAASLLNLYLMAIHGQGKWVRAYHDGQFYLNHELLEKSELSIEEIQKKAASFLQQVEGVAYALPASDLIAASMNLPVMESLKLNYHPRRSGDLLIALAPGWREELPSGDFIARKWVNERVPLVFYGWKVTRREQSQPIRMIDVAPTICSFLSVGMTSGCEGVPIEGVTR
jgi:hypothetical protein